MVTKQRVQLVKAPLPPDSVNCLRSRAYPPYNLVSLATFLRDKTGVIAEVIDGELFSLEEIVKKLDNGIVGISSTSLAYPTALEIAKAAKEKGAVVVLGGVHAYHLPEKILQKREFIDVVVFGQGEETFFQLIRGDKPKDITNIVYRKNGKI